MGNGAFKQGLSAIDLLAFLRALFPDCQRMRNRSLRFAGRAGLCLWNLVDQLFRSSLHNHPKRNRVLCRGFIGHVDFL